MKKNRKKNKHKFESVLFDSESKGLSLVELLIVIAILGVLSIISITAYNRYINKAKQEQHKQDYKNISIAADSYLKSNSKYAPKNIGETVIIMLKDLKNNKYLKDDILNNNKESCMDKSYVTVTKISKTEYSYQTYLYCGDDEVEIEEKKEPEITIAINNNNSSSNLKTAKFSITYKGNKNDNSIGIASYSYYIEVKKENDSEYTTVYSVINHAGDGKKTIEVVDVLLSDYLDFSGVTDVVIKATAINTDGGRNEKTVSALKQSGNYTFKDEVAPLCPTDKALRVGEPNENEWLNKIDYINNNINRKITLTCNDGDGSGCQRETFTKTWPDVNTTTSIRNGTITLKDNSGNTTDCQVRVNIDYVSPSITVKKENGVKQSVSITNTGHEREAIPTGALANNNYNNLVSGWLNNANYPNGITYKIALSDDIELSKYEWNSGNSADSKTENISGTSKDIEISFTVEGERSGELAVYDKAGNITKMNISAKLDRTAPQQPTITYKLSTQTTNETASNNNYTIDSWTKYNVYTSTNINISDNLSGWNHNEYITSSNGGSSYSSSYTSSNNKWFSSEGQYGIKYRSCDAAGNCSSPKEGKVIKIDKTKPSCSISINGTKGDNDWYKEKDVSLTLTKGDTGGSKLKEYGLTTSTQTTYNKEDKGTQGNTSKDGIIWHGYVKDNAGNVSSCTTSSFKVDKDSPTCEIKVTGKKGNGAWYKEQDVTLTLEKKDVGNSDLAAGYGFTKSNTASYSSTSLTNTQSDTTGTTWYGYVKDKAGNKGSCKVENLKVDTKKPKCSISVSDGTSGDNGWYKGKNIKLTLTKNDDDGVSGISDSYGFTTSGTATYNSTTSTVTQSDTKGTKWYGYVTDIAGNVNSCSKTVKVDTQKPSCSIAVTNGTSGENGWYKSKSVELTLTTTNDTDATSELSSQYGFTTSGTASYDSTKKTVTQTDTKSATWHGYVKDEAGNSNSCSKTVKVDTKKPSCSIAVTKGTQGDNGWYKEEAVELTLTTTNDSAATSNLSSQYGFTTSATASYNSTKKTVTQNSTTDSGVIWHGYVKDEAGNANQCDSGTLKVDKDVPKCGTVYGAGSSNDWSRGVRNVSIGCSDNHSGCTLDTFYHTFAASTNGVITTDNITISDSAGNTKDCPVGVYLDNKAPTCGTVTGASTEWTKEDRTITVGCNDSDSGCTSVSKTFTTTATTGNITIKDSVGNSKDCNVNVYVDKTKPIIKLKQTSGISRDFSTAANEFFISPYNNGYTNLVNGWINDSVLHSIYHLNNMEYKFAISDAQGIKRYDWETNKAGKSGLNITTKKIADDYVATSGNISYSNPGGIASTLTESVTSKELSLSFVGDSKEDGERLGRLTVYDIAGNSASMIVTANIDKVKPTIPEIKLEILKTDNTTDLYDKEWTNRTVLSSLESEPTDSVSKVSNIIYTLLIPGNNNFADSTDLGTAYETKEPISAEGEWKVKYDVCDTAGNCSTKTARDIKIDTTPPTIECSINASKKVSQIDKIEDNIGGSGLEIQEYTGRPEAYEITGNDYVFHQAETYTPSCGNPTTFQITALTHDNAGNVATDYCGEIERTECPVVTTCDDSDNNYKNCPWVSSCRKGITAIYSSSSFDSNTYFANVCHTDIYLPPSFWKLDSSTYPASRFACGLQNHNAVDENSSTKLYIVETSDNYYRVCFESGQGGPRARTMGNGESAGTKVCGYIRRKCISPNLNNFCAFSDCPDGV